MANVTIAQQALASTVTALTVVVYPAVVSGKALVLVGKGALWVVSWIRPAWIGSALLGAYCSKNAAERKAKLKWKSEALAKLADADADTLKLLLGELPTWCNYPDYDRVTWLNTLLMQLWPSVDEFVGAIVQEAAGPALAKVSDETTIKLLGIRNISIVHFSLGKPPKITGIKSWNPGQQTDSIVMELEIRLAGCDPNVVVAIDHIATQLVVQVADLQLTAKARVILAPLVGKIPGFGALSVSIIGYPYLDFSLVALSGDLMAIPGLETIVGEAVRKAVSKFVWPRREVIPIIKGTDIGPLQARPAGVFLIRVIKARDLPSVDLGIGRSIDPYFKIRVDRQAPTSYARTSTKSNTQNPEYNEIYSLPVVDPSIQGIHFTLWDANSGGKDEKIAKATLHCGNAFEPGAKGFWHGQLQLHDCREMMGSGEEGGGGGARTAFAQGAKALQRGISAAANTASLGAIEKKSKEDIDKAGTILVEVTYAPLFPFGAKPWVPPELQPPKPGSPEAVALEAEAARKAEEEAAAAAAEAAKAAVAPPQSIRQKVGGSLWRVATFVHKAAQPKPPPPPTKEQRDDAEKERAYIDIMDHLAKTIPRSDEWKKLPPPGVLSIRVIRAENLNKKKSYREPLAPFVTFYVHEREKVVNKTRRRTEKVKGEGVLNPTWNEDFELFEIDAREAYHLQFMVFVGDVHKGVAAAVEDAANMVGSVVNSTVNLAAKVGTLGVVNLNRKGKEGDTHAQTGGIMGREKTPETASLPEDLGDNFAGRKSLQIKDIARDCEAKGLPCTYDLLLDDAVGPAHLHIIAEWRVASYRDLESYRRERAAFAVHEEAEGRKVNFEDGHNGHGHGHSAHAEAAKHGGSSVGESSQHVAAGHALNHAKSSNKLTDTTGGHWDTHHEEDEDEDREMPRGMFSCFGGAPASAPKHDSKRGKKVE